MTSTPGIASRVIKDKWLTDLKGETIKVGVTTAVIAEDDEYGDLTKAVGVGEQTVTWGAISGTTTRTIANDVAYSQASDGTSETITNWYAYYNDGVSDLIVASGKLHDSGGNDITKTIANVGDIVECAIGDLTINIT